MDRLWAPWRENYVKRVHKEIKGSIFTKILKEKKDVQNYIFARTKLSFAVLNIYPYNNGHALVIPNREVRDLCELTQEERDDLLDLLQTTQSILDEVLEPAGFNIGINLGRAAGAGMPDHLHIHIVPRWRNDVNFMPVTANTKVVSESLRVLYKRLVDAYKKRH